MSEHTKYGYTVYTSVGVDIYMAWHRRGVQADRGGAMRRTFAAYVAPPGRAGTIELLDRHTALIEPPAAPAAGYVERRSRY